jgi:hypothetical protein
MRELLLARARGEHEKSGVIKSLQRTAINTQNPNVKFGRQAREHGAKLRRPSRESACCCSIPLTIGTSAGGQIQMKNAAQREILRSRSHPGLLISKMRHPAALCKINDGKCIVWVLIPFFPVN